MITKRCDSCGEVIPTLVSARGSIRDEFVKLPDVRFTLGPEGQYTFCVEMDVAAVVRQFDTWEKHFCMQCIVWGFTEGVVALAKKYDLDVSRVTGIG